MKDTLRIYWTEADQKVYDAFEELREKEDRSRCKLAKLLIKKALKDLGYKVE